MAFEITRADGRSNQQVLLDRVKKDEPDTRYAYDELQELLGFKDRSRVQQVVTSAIPRMLREFGRTLMNIRGEGYRLARANEHMMLAHDRKRRSDRQMKIGLATLRHVHWDEMDEQTRLAHQGQLIIMTAICENQRLMQSRQDSIEASIQSLTSRVGDLEK